MSSQRWTVGNYVITSVLEEETHKIPAELFYPGVRAEDVQRHAWLVPDYADARGRLSFRVQAFVIEGHGRRMVVDPCVGNGRRRSNPYWNMRSYPFLETFSAAGLRLEEIDTVVHTHLHADHLGWGTRRVDEAWVPTFPNARYLYTQRELSFRAGSGNDAEDAWIYGDSVAPIIAAGLSDIVDENAQLAPGIRLESTPGHSPGHVSLWIESGGALALITGDIVHHPVQCAEPGWKHAFDADADEARATRQRILGRAWAQKALVFGTHFPTRPAGRLSPEGSVYRFLPLD